MGAITQIKRKAEMHYAVMMTDWLIEKGQNAALRVDP